MPTGDKNFAVNTPQSTAVLMDIVAKLKQELQQARAENGKLTDKLNCLLSLIKRSWTGDETATHHLANIVGIPPPNFEGIHSNTPVPETKSRATKHWERLVLKLLEKEYAKIQAEIREHQQQYILNRQLYMNEVLRNHQAEMAKLPLNHRKSSRVVEDVDKQFMKCYSAKIRHRPKAESRILHRPKSAYQKVPKTASDMVDYVEMTVGSLLNPHPTPAGSQTSINTATNNSFTNLYKLTQETENKYQTRMPFDDPRRYKQNNLFDPEVIFGPEEQETESKFHSATAGVQSTDKDGRPGSAVFLTEKPARPLQYETTRPLILKPKSAAPRSRLKSGHHKKERNANGKKGLERQNLMQNDNAQQEGDQEKQEENGEIESAEARRSQEDEEEQDEEVVPVKPSMKVHVRRPEAVNKFVDDLKKMNEMEENFKKTAIELQKKIGITEEGMVF